MSRPGEERAAYYASVLKQRGAEALNQLKASVRIQWAQSSPPPAGSGSATQSSLF